MKQHTGRNIHWESAASPLIDGDLVFVAGGGPGESLLAFDKKDGHVVWKGQDETMTQATPVAATILGERQVIFFTSKGLVSVAPKTGTVLWRYTLPDNGAAGCSPVVSGDIVYCFQILQRRVRRLQNHQDGRRLCRDGALAGAGQ